MWEHLKESVHSHATGIIRDISDRFANTDEESTSQLQQHKKDAMNNVVTPNSIPKFTLPPLLSHDLATSNEDEFDEISPINEDKGIHTNQQNRYQMPDSCKSAAISTDHLPTNHVANSRRSREKSKRIDQQTQPGLSLHHLLSTKSGFSTLTESPNTRRKESLFLSPPITCHDVSNESRRYDVITGSSSESDVSRNVSPTSSPLIEKLRSKRLLGRSAAIESDSNNSSCHSSPFSSPAQARKISFKPSLDVHAHYNTIDGLPTSTRHKQHVEHKSPTSPSLSYTSKQAYEMNQLKRCHSASSVMNIDVKTNTSSETIKSPRLHVMVTYLQSQHKLNVSIIEGENFYVGRVVYLKISLLPRYYGHHRTDSMKVESSNADIRERLTFDSVKEEDLPHMSLEISCKEKISRLRNAIVVGKCIVTLCDIDIRTANGMWLDLKSPALEEAPHIQLSLCYHAMLGFVTVEVIAARNIPKGSLGRHQDCYVVLTEEPHRDKSTKKQTKISHRNKDPVFQESFMFSMPNDQLVIVATLFVKDKVKGHWTANGEVKLGQAVQHWSGQMQWIQALDREGQPVTFWHLLKLT